MKISDAPLKLRPLIFLGFDYHPERTVGDEAYGDCPLCGSTNKFYVNSEAGLWNCKAGRCGESGNVYTFLQKWYEAKVEEQLPKTSGSESDDVWVSLANDRQLAPEVLQEAGLVHEDGLWYIPVFNAAGRIVNLRTFKQGSDTGLHGIPGLDVSFYGLENLADDRRVKEPVYICEGEWDAISLRHLLQMEKVPGVVVGTPGAGIWKDSWTDLFIGRSVVLCYDNDQAGSRGTKRVWAKLAGRVSDIKYIAWPEGLPDGFDVRDFVVRDGSFGELKGLIQVYVSDEQRDQTNLIALETRPTLPNSNRPSFEQVINVFHRHLYMTTDMTMALKVIFAVVLSNQIKGDPLWMHIVSPPGTAKTELLMPLGGCPSCYLASNLTPHSLVSGYTGANGDPSLLPKLNGRTFVLKDFTEVLSLPKIQKDEIYGTLRGAYDGQVVKVFGNGVTRVYQTNFNMISGVTHAVFGERSVSLGERFLVFHLVKGVGFYSGDAIRAAIRNVGKEREVREDLQDVVRRFLEVRFTPADMPQMTDDNIDKIVALSNLVAVLRANVERVYHPGGLDKITYRPQHEMGTRLGKQLSKLAYGLAMVNTPPRLDAAVMDVVVRVALDTCTGLNLEAIAYLVEHPSQTIEALCEALSLPHSTLREQLDDMTMLGAIRVEKQPNPSGRGAPKYLYFASDNIATYWKQAGLLKEKPDQLLPENRAANRKVRRVRVKVPSE